MSNKRRLIGPTDTATAWNRAERRQKVRRFPPGERIQKRRKLIGLSLRELARRVGRPVEHVVAIEAGRGTYTLTEISAYAQALDCTTEDLIRPLDQWRPPSL